MWKCGDVEMWKLGDALMVSRQVCRTLPTGDGVGEKIGNLFPEGIQLGSIKIARDNFRIPEGMRPFPSTRLPYYDCIGAYLRHPGAKEILNFEC